MVSLLDEWRSKGRRRLGAAIADATRSVNTNGRKTPVESRALRCRYYDTTEAVAGADVLWATLEDALDAAAASELEVVKR
jgi:hypothetical protein